MPADMTKCEICGSTQLFHEQPEYDGDTMTGAIRCEDCDAEYRQTWTLQTRDLVRPG